MRKYLARLFLAFLLAMPGLPQSSSAQGIDLDKILSEFLAKDPSDRRNAREQLEQHLSSLDPQARKAALSGLVVRMAEGDYYLQFGTALALSQLRDPWETLDQAGDTQKIYDMMRTSKDPTLRGNLDDALANAKGLYFDAIRDYNNIDESDEKELGKIEETRAKLLRMASFNESSYAENAQFYLGQYFARLASVSGRDDPFIRTLNIEESNKWFDTYIEATEKGTFPTQNFLFDGYFYRALNEVIAGNPSEAIKRLMGINVEGDNRIYVYQFFYSGEKGTVVDRVLEARPLIDIVLANVKKYGPKLPENQRDLVGAVNRIKG